MKAETISQELIEQAPIMLSLLKEEVLYLDMWIERLQDVGLMAAEMKERKEFILMTIKKATP